MAKGWKADLVFSFLVSPVCRELCGSKNICISITQGKEGGGWRFFGFFLSWFFFCLFVLGGKG